MRLAASIVFALAGALVFTMSASPTAQAQPAGACSPAVPRGFVLARVEQADGTGQVTLRFGADAVGRTKPKVGDPAYVLTCSGARAAGRGSYAEIRAVNGTAAQAVFALPASQIQGKVVAIDTGYDSEPPLFEGEVRPPSGYVQASLTNIQIAYGKTQISIGASYTDGIFPGAKGYLVNEKGQPVRDGAFVVSYVFSEHASAATVDVSLDTANQNQQVFIERSRKRCDAPDPVSPATSELAKTLSGGAAPPGYMFVDVPTTRTNWPTINLPVGTDQSVMPRGRAWFVLGRPNPGVPLAIVPAIDGIRTVRTGSSQVTATESLRATPMRVLVQTAKCTIR